MDDEDKKQIGNASTITMEEFLRLMVKNMIEADTDTLILDSVLNGVGGNKPPVVRVQLQLLQID